MQSKKTIVQNYPCNDTLEIEVYVYINYLSLNHRRKYYLLKSLVLVKKSKTNIACTYSIPAGKC